MLPVCWLSGIRRTSEQWLALFDQHKTSALTQTTFAKQHGIDLSYFSLHKRQLLAWQQDDNDGLVELTPRGILFRQPMILKNAMLNCIYLPEPMRCGSLHCSRPCRYEDVYRHAQNLSAQTAGCFRKSMIARSCKPWQMSI